MGLAIDREDFSAEDYARFSARLSECLDALASLLGREGFGVGPRTVGAELELHLVDPAGRPLPINRTVLARTLDPRVTVELDRFNLECNVRYSSLAGRPFRAFSAELESALREVQRAAAGLGARAVAIGILPTLRESDMRSVALTQLPRYRVLSKALRDHMQGKPFHVHISGPETLTVEADDVTLEGACTSLQYHLRVNPADFARFYNAAQLATGPVLALCGNSPLFLGKRLWQETRVALFRQATDARTEEEAAFALPTRVSFGHGWVRRGAHELFAENVALYPALLPVLGNEAPLEVVAQGGVPRLEELRLHQGTVWTWNRAVFDPAEGGHVRIEMRALPAGPTVVDMLANGALLFGLTLSLAEEVDALLPGMPFRHAIANFVGAARHGLEATMLWPSRTPPSPHMVPAQELLPVLLPRAREGLLSAGVEADDVDRLFDVLAGRLRTGQTGARWQLATLGRLEAIQPRDEALATMLERYMELWEGGSPVHTWPVR